LQDGRTQPAMEGREVRNQAAELGVRWCRCHGGLRSRSMAVRQSAERAARYTSASSATASAHNRPPSRLDAVALAVAPSPSFVRGGVAHEAAGLR